MSLAYKWMYVYFKPERNNLIMAISFQSSSSAKSSKEDIHRETIGSEDIEDAEMDRTMMSSPLSWEDECNMSSKSSFGPYEDMRSSGVQWHRLSGDSWEEQLAAQWPHLSDSVVSVPSSFQFTERSVDIDYGEKDTGDPNDVHPSLQLRRSVSESYIPHYGSLSPPPKNFYHLVPTPLSSKNRKSAMDSPFSPKRGNTQARAQQKFSGQVFSFEHRERVCRKRSSSLPSLKEPSVDSPLLVSNYEDDNLFTDRMSHMHEASKYMH